MKIRLRVRTSPTAAFEWEHAGPRIDIGKEGCHLDLLLEEGVSRRHAQIELSASGAVLRDTNSTNGTYLNGTPLSGAMRLSVGDQISLGRGGPRLDVLSLDLTAAPTAFAAASIVAVPKPAQEREPAPPRQPTHSTAGSRFAVAIAVVVVAAIGGGVVWWRTNQDDSTTSQAQAPETHTQEGQAPEARAPEAQAPAAIAARRAETTLPAKAEEPERRAEAPSAPPSAARTPTQSTGVAAPSPSPAVLTVAEPIEKVIEPHEAAVVWIGYELNGKLFPYATAWALRPNVIVTTAETARQLKVILDKSSSGEFGPATLVARDASRVIPVHELRIHPAYDAQQPAAPASIGHNLAVALLDGEVQAVCPLATEADIAKINAQTPLLAIGYIDESTTREPFDKVKNLVRLERQPTRVTASDPPGSDRPLSYQLHVGETETVRGPLENMAGSPVFNDQGRVVGVLAVLGTSFRMSSLDSVRDWLEGIRP